MLYRKVHVVNMYKTALLYAHLLYSIEKLGKYKTRFLMEEKVAS